MASLRKIILSIFIFVLIAILLCGFILFYIMILGGVVYPSKITTKVEKNIDSIDSDLELIYFSDKDGSLYLNKIKSKEKKLLAVDINEYFFNHSYNKIAFVTKRPSTSKLNNKKVTDKSLGKIGKRYRLYVIDLSTQEIEYEIALPYSYDYYIDTPQFSPDGTKLFYTASKYKEFSSIYIVDLINKTNNFIVKLKDDDMRGGPRWSKNGEDIWLSMPDSYGKIENPLKNMNKKITIIHGNKNVDPLFVGDCIDENRSCNVEKHNLFKNTDDNHLVFTENNKTIVKYRIGHEFYSVIGKGIHNMDYTPDLKYLVFEFKGKIYLVDLLKEKTFFIDNGSFPSFIGDKHGLKSEYDKIKEQYFYNWFF